MESREIIANCTTTETEDIPSETKVSLVKVLSIRKSMFGQTTNRSKSTGITNKSCSTARSSLFLQKPLFHYTQKNSQGDVDTFSKNRLHRNPSICLDTPESKPKVVKLLKLRNDAVSCLSSRKVNSILPSRLSSINRYLASSSQFSDSPGINKKRPKADRVTLGSLMKKDSDIDLGCSYALSQYLSPRIGENPTLMANTARPRSSQALGLLYK